MADQTMNDRVSAVSGGYQDRVAQIGTGVQQSASLDLVNQLNQLNQQQRQLQEAPRANMQDEMTSGPGIAALLTALLGGGIAASQGSNEGVMAANSALQSYMGSRQGVVQNYNAGLDAQQEQINKMIDANRQRLTTLLQSQPDMFLDPETGKPAVDPRLLGYAATGYLIPINPSSNHALTNRLKTQEELIAFGKDLYLKGETAAQRANGLSMIGQGLGVQWSDQMYQTAASGNEREVYMQLLSDGYFTPDSVFAVMLKSQQESKSIVELADMFVVDTTQDKQGTLTIPQAQLKALAELSRRMEANPMLFDPQMSFEDRVMEAFPEAGEEDYRTLLLDRWNESSISKELIARQMESSLATIMTLDQMSKDGLDQRFLDPYNISKEDADWRTQLAVQQVQHVLPALATIGRQETLRSVSYFRRQIEAQLTQMEGFQDAPRDVVRAFALRYVLDRTQKHTNRARNVLNYDAFKGEVANDMANPEMLRQEFSKFYKPSSSETSE